MGALPSLVLVDTGTDTGGTAVQTRFRFPLFFSSPRGVNFTLESGGHESSPSECLAPFRQDPMERIIALSIKREPHYFVLRVRTLLELLEGREGTDIGWDEWKDHLVVPSLPRRAFRSRRILVSGCRLFFIYPETYVGEQVLTEVYDFSPRGRANCLSKRTIEELGTVDQLSSTGAKVRFPRGNLSDLRSGHESIIFSHVSATVFCFLPE